MFNHGLWDSLECFLTKMTSTDLITDLLPLYMLTLPPTDDGFFSLDNTTPLYAAYMKFVSETFSSTLLAFVSAIVKFNIL